MELYNAAAFKRLYRNAFWTSELVGHTGVLQQAWIYKIAVQGLKLAQAQSKYTLHQSAQHHRPQPDESHVEALADAVELRCFGGFKPRGPAGGNSGHNDVGRAQGVVWRAALPH